MPWGPSTGNRDLDGKVKCEYKFLVDKVVIRKDPAGPSEVDSEESDAAEEGNEDVTVSPPYDPGCWGNFKWRLGHENEHFTA